MESLSKCSLPVDLVLCSAITPPKAINKRWTKVNINSKGNKVPYQQPLMDFQHPNINLNTVLKQRFSLTLQIASQRHVLCIKVVMIY